MAIANITNNILTDSGVATSALQIALNGTGFVKIVGTTISYDNSTYLTTSSASSTYLPLAGGTLTGALGGTSATFSGNVAIGATSASTRLQVVDDGNTFCAHFSANALTNGIAIGTVTGNYASIQGYTKTFSATTNISLQSSGGNVGIGTNTPGNKLAILSSDEAANPTLGTNAGKFGIFNGTGAGTYGMIMGVINNGNSYLQVQRIDGTATAYNLLLQPSGGNVGIGTGTSNPIAALQVSAIPSTNGDSVYQIVPFDTNTATSRVGAGISFGGYYNGTTDYTSAFASIKGFKENLTNNDYAGALAFMTRVNGGGSTERMRITSGGNVLIGTTDDGGKVVSYTTTAATQFKAAGTAPAITFSNTVLSPTIGGVLGVCTAASQFFTGTASSDMVLANQFSAGALIFGTNNLARMRIKASGVINITSIPTSSAGLVSGDIYSNAGILTIV